MELNEKKVQVISSITDDPFQHPEESLRVISNYSSLERMYHKSKQQKIRPNMNLSKKDSLNIAGWENNYTKDRQIRINFSRSKFKTLSIPNKNLLMAQTISSSQRAQSSKSNSRRKVSPANQKLLHATNFKCRTISPRKQPLSHRTLSFDFEEEFRQRGLRQKQEILHFYQNEAMKRKEVRQNYRPNPQFCLPITQYPVMNGLKKQKGARRLRKQQFLRRHQNRYYFD